MGLEAVRLLVLDHDGVLTDNHVYTNQHGEEMCRYYRGDGIGIERVKALGVRVVCLSSEANPVVAARCLKLKLRCIQGSKNKLWDLGQEAGIEAIPLSGVAYVGNDVNDLECLKAVGFPFVPQDCEKALRASRYVGRDIEVSADILRFTRLIRKGGEGCVREVCDLIADAKEAAR